MKKIYISFLIAILSTSWLMAQEPGDGFAQPAEFVGRKINASGEVTKEYEASFSYASNGKLNVFQFPEWIVTSSFRYENDYLTTVTTNHSGEWPYYSVVHSYTYEEGRVKTEADEWYGMGLSKYFEYEYYEDGRLYKKHYAAGNPEEYYAYSIFEYENEGKTKIESYYGWTSYQGTLVWGLGHRTAYLYDDSYVLLSEQTDKYNGNGEITNSKRKVYSYSPIGQLEAEVSQTLTDNEWANNSIHRYIYDEEGNLTEQQDGAWSTTLNDWNITQKTVHEYSQKNMTYTVSFYKKSGDNWVWDTFNAQKIFFASELYWQQRSLDCFAYEEIFGSAQINQFEFDMVFTKTPTYMSVKDNDATVCQVYPNPGSDEITIKAPVENSVIRFFDLQGRMMLAKPFDFSTTIGTGDWSPGIYLWEIWNGTQKGASGKWVKE